MGRNRKKEQEIRILNFVKKFVNKHGGQKYPTFRDYTDK